VEDATSLGLRLWRVMKNDTGSNNNLLATTVHISTPRPFSSPRVLRLRLCCNYHYYFHTLRRSFFGGGCLSDDV